MHKHLFYNTKRHLLTLLSKDKLKIGLWIGSITAFVVIVGFAYPALFPDASELVGLVEAMKNPMMVAMFGPVFDEVNYTIAVSLSNQMLMFSMIFSAIMSIFIASRMTRGDEEDGILELIQSLPIGRLTHTLATIIIIVLMNLVLSLLIGFGLALIPQDSITFAGSMTFGFAVGAAGIFMGSITLIIAQLFENNRTVMGLSFLVFGIMYIVRGIGDLGENLLVWLIPLNWPLRTEAYVNNYNYLNLLTFVLSAALFYLALILNKRRDLESGIIPQKSGHIKASKTLKTPLGLVLTLLKTSMIAWLATVFVLGIMYGSIFGDLDTFIEGSDIFQEMLPGGEFELNVQFMSIIMMVIAIASGIGPLMFLNRLATEEKKNRTEHIYARSVSRMTLMTIFTSIALISAVIILFAGALGMLSGIQASMDDPIKTSYIMQAGFAYLPALLFMVGLGTVIIGYKPEKTYLIWIYFGYSFFVIYMGNLLNVPEFFTYLTPFGYIDQLPIESFRILPTIIILGITVILIITGFYGYKTRDLKG